MNKDEYLNKLVNEMIEKHHCHSIILYGSRADNTNTQESDIDIACFTESGEEYTDCRLRNGLFLDAWIYPEKEANNVEKFLKLLTSKILIQKDTFLDDLLKQVKERFEKGPEILKDSEKQLRITWCNKTFLRTKRCDTEGNYRKIWLINDLLQIYFELRDLWYLGPKVSLAWLKNNKEEDFKLFDLLFANPENTEYLEKAVSMVIQKH